MSVYDKKGQQIWKADILFSPGNFWKIKKAIEAMIREPQRGLHADISQKKSVLRISSHIQVDIQDAITEISKIELAK